MLALDGAEKDLCLALREEAHTNPSQVSMDAVESFRLSMIQKYSLEQDVILDAKCAILFTQTERGQGLKTLHNHV